MVATITAIAIKISIVDSTKITLRAIIAIGLTKWFREQKVIITGFKITIVATIIVNVEANGIIIVVIIRN